MSLFHQGLSLKALLENPALLNHSSLQDERGKEKKIKDPNAPSTLYNSQSAFLGPQLWERTLPYDGTDFKLEYMDLDEFLEENGIPLGEDQFKAASHPAPKSSSPLPADPSPSPVSPPVSQLRENLLQKALNQQNQSPQPVNEPVEVLEVPDASVSSPMNTIQKSPPRPGDDSHPIPFSRGDLALATIPGSHEDFDPTKRAFSEEELRPQPMIKKSRKIFVTDNAKDDKYWARRQKNNVAAKRSRDARRVKENQIAMRAAFLERQNDQLTIDVKKVRAENVELKKRLEKYEG